MAGNACEHGVVKKSLVPTSLIFKKKRYHGCLICISGIVSERYTDPSRKLPRYSSDFLGFIKFRSTGERNFCANLLMVLKHLEETDLLSAEGRQRVLMRVMRAFSMATIEAGSTNIPREGATTDAAVDKLDASRVLLELATALPVPYWAGLAQHSQNLDSHNLFAATSRRAQYLWGQLLKYVEAEMKLPRPLEPTLFVGTRVEAQFAGRRAFFGATVLKVHPPKPGDAHEGPEGAYFDLKYDSTFKQTASAKPTSSTQRSGSGGQGGQRSQNNSSSSSSVLDNGEVECRVPLALLRLEEPIPPSTPREDALLRMVAHLQRLLRLGTERPCELLHHREHYLPPVASVLARDPDSGQTALPQIAPGSGGAVMWARRKPVPVRGLFDVNRTDSLVYRGKYGWPSTDDSF